MKLDSLIEEIVGLGGSDIYLHEGEMIYFRYLDSVRKMEQLCDKNLIEEIRNKIFRCDLTREGRGVHGDYTFTHICRIRCNLFKSQGKECAVLRLINQKDLNFDNLGISRELPEILVKRRGFSLVCGKTGSGKSTTVAAIIQELLKNYSVHIISLEDPVEFQFESLKGIINQRELGSDFLEFSAALKSALRQSPDFIFLGEIRERESLETALRASESGIGVISTFHSLGALQTINKIRTYFDSSEEQRILQVLSNELNFIQSQLLRYDENSKKIILDYELMKNNTAISNLIRNNQLSQIENQIILGRASGMKTFDQ